MRLKLPLAVIVLLPKDAVTLSAAATLRAVSFCNLQKAQEPQLLCDFLMEIGAQSTSITDANRDTDDETPIFKEPGDDNIWNAAVVCGDHAVGKNVWTSCNVTAHFAASTDLEQIAALVEDVMDISLSYEVAPVPNRDWVVHVQKSWKPILVEGILLRFPWHTEENVDEILQVEDEEAVVEIRLEGGIAFGTGEHATTQLCLGWIQRLLASSDNTINTLMDYGTGSGVLGLAASALQPSIQAVGVDIDIDAVRIANSNSVTNNFKLQSYLPPLEDSADMESKSVLMRGMASASEGVEILPGELNGPIYDALVANILAGPLVSLAPTIANLLKAGGYLGLSGILTPQAQPVIDAYEKYFDNVKVEKELNGWVLITGIRKRLR